MKKNQTAKDKHIAALAELCKIPMNEAEALYRRLRRLENRARQHAINISTYPERFEGQYDAITAAIKSSLKALFPINGVFLNLDPRGYALKMEHETFPEGMHKDFGEYGILAPEF